MYGVHLYFAVFLHGQPVSSIECIKCVACKGFRQGEAYRTSPAWRKVRVRTATYFNPVCILERVVYTIFCQLAGVMMI